MPGCGSGAVVCSCSLLFGCHLGRRQAETPLTPLSKFSQPAIGNVERLRVKSTPLAAGVRLRIYLYRGVCRRSGRQHNSTPPRSLGLLGLTDRSLALAKLHKG